MLEKDILAKTYYDMATVYRKQPTEDANGITSNQYKLTHTAVSCALSKKQLSTTNQTESNNIKYDSVLFLDPSILILAGDKIVVTIGANEQTRIMYAGEPFIYSSHQEVPLLRDERA